MKRAIAIILLLVIAASVVLAFIPFGTNTPVVVDNSAVGCEIITNDPTIEGDSVILVTSSGEDVIVK